MDEGLEMVCAAQDGPYDVALTGPKYKETGDACWKRLEIDGMFTTNIFRFIWRETDLAVA